MALDILLFFIHFLLILSVIFLEHKNSNEALLWVCILSLFPVAGIFFYLIFGSTTAIKLTYAIHNKKLEKAYRQRIQEQLDSVAHAHVRPGDDTMQQVEAMVRFNMNYSESLLTQYNQIEQITNGKENYARLFADLQAAEHSIHIQYYAIHNDMVGQQLLDILTKKAKNGVQVKVMFDGFGSLTTPNRFFAPLVKAGGEFRRLKTFLTHYRNHRKIVVIDGKIAYTGGMNIGKQYQNMDKKKTPWRDTQIRVEGDGVYMLQYYFLSDWISSVRAKSLAAFQLDTQRLFPAHSIKKELYCQFVAGGAVNDKEYIKMSYLKMISSARESIRLQTPYFIPDGSIMDALKMAAASGVEIQIMLPNIKPNFFLEHVNNYYVSQLLDYGVKVYRYQGYIHAKTMSIDSLVTCIGSVNLDMRSLQVDDEICGFVYNEQFAADYEIIFEMDKLHCKELDYAAFRNRSFLSKMAERFFCLFAPLM